MKIECEIHADETIDVIRDRLIRYYTAIGYRHEGGNTNVIVFKRGSVLRGLFSFSPKSMKSVVEASISRALGEQSNVLVNYNVNATGHSVITQEEIDYWNAEMGALVEAVTSGFYQPAGDQPAERAAIRGNWRYVGSSLITIPLVLVAMIPMIVVGYLVLKPISRLLLQLLPIVGADGLSLISAFLLLITFAGLMLFPIPQLATRLANWLSDLRPAWAVKLIQLAIIMVSLGLVLGLVTTTLGVIKYFDSDQIFIILGGIIAGGLVIGFLADRREKKSQPRR